MRAQGWTFDNIQGFVKNTLPEVKDYRELGPHVTSVLEQTIQRDADGTAIVPGLEGKEIKSYQDMVKVLRAMWNIRVGDQLFADNATAHKANSARLGNEIIKRFGPQIAVKYGIDVPKAAAKEAERMGEPSIVSLLRKGSEALGGLGLLEKEL